MLTKGQGSAAGTITSDFELPQTLLVPLFFSYEQNETDDLFTQILLEFFHRWAYNFGWFNIFIQLF